MSKETPMAKTKVTLLNVVGRNYSSLSVHPDSNELLFLEFRADLPEVSRLLRYHLNDQQLSYYELPKEFVTLDAAFSPSGKYIVMRRAPNVRGDEAVKRDAYSHSEIVLMNADGTNLKTIPISEGLKMAPVMAHDDTRIAYWRATQRPDNSKSFAFRFDVWEVNLKTGEEKPYSGLHQFFQGGRLQYLTGDDQMIIGAGFPKIDPQRMNADGSSKNNLNGSEMYLFDRRISTPPEPLMTDVNSAGYPSVDSNGNIYFQGFLPGTSFFRWNALDKKLTQWEYPWQTISPPALDAVVLPDGSAIPFIFIYINEDRSKRGIGIFDIKHEAWTQINIPSLESAKLFSLTRSKQ